MRCSQGTSDGIICCESCHLHVFGFWIIQTSGVCEHFFETNMMELKGQLCRCAGQFLKAHMLNSSFPCWTKDIVIAGGGRHHRLLSGNLARGVGKEAARWKLPLVLQPSH